MRTRLLKAATLVVALGFLVGATIAAGSDKKSARPKPAEVKPDAGQAPAPPTFLPATKAAMPMHFDEPPAQAKKKDEAPKQAPQQAAPAPQATP